MADLLDGVASSAITTMSNKSAPSPFCTGLVCLTTPVSGSMAKCCRKEGGDPAAREYLMRERRVSPSSARIFSGRTRRAPEDAPLVTLAVYVSAANRGSRSSLSSTFTVSVVVAENRLLGSRALK